MKGVHLYLQVRRAVRIEGLSERAAVRDRPAHGEQDDEVFGATGLCAPEAAGTAEA